jgi:hypothetical protein
MFISFNWIQSIKTFMFFDTFIQYKLECLLMVKHGWSSLIFVDKAGDCKVFAPLG